MKLLNKIAAGIVLYNPDLTRLKENIEAILPQVNSLLLIDNASSNIDEIEFEINSINNVFLIKNSINNGIATALNQIVNFYNAKKYSWVLTLDQDSVCPSNIIEEYKKYISYERIGIITPNIIDRNNLIQGNNIKNLQNYQYVKRCITSASLLNINLCENIGFFDEKMFIDLVDFEYCIRVEKAGYKILRANQVQLIHQLGDLQVYNFFGKNINITNHSKVRNYYYARNSIYYLKIHESYLSKRKIYTNLFIKIIKILGFEKKKFGKIKAIYLGIKAGKKL